jgi:glycosyltransferase involved in cell wall biosynthesis
MRIGVLAPISWRVPPRRYGPWEYFASLLTEGLVRRGVDVTLFATADSITSAKLDAICAHPYSEDASIEPRVWEALHAAHAFERAADFDIIHNSADYLPLTYSRLTKTPVLTTIHGFSSARILPVFERYNRATHYVAISNADRSPRLDYVATIYHGIPLEDFKPRRAHGDYLLFFGRIHPDKGTAEAIDIAQRTNRRLIIAGIVHDEEYYRQSIAPRVDGDRVKYIGAVTLQERSDLLGNAFALLHLINFDEPFGLSMIEAMACGLPVIARGRGSVPEIIKDRETGFIVNSMDEAIEALPAVGLLDRAQIRRVAERRFSQERMVDDYVRAYAAVLGLRTPA